MWPRTYTVVETGLGWVGLLRSGHGLCGSTLPCDAAVAALAALPLRATDIAADEHDFAAASEFLRTQVQGRASVLREPLDLSSGSPFQQAVWEAVSRIPFGETRSYGWVAAEAGFPQAAHAAGQAVGGNPLPLFVPCHRVVRADGSLGGFGRGATALALKRSLLRCEGVLYVGETPVRPPRRA